MDTAKDQGNSNPADLFGDDAARESPRDSLFLTALVGLAGQPPASNVRVRNLSRGGFLAESPTPFSVGMVLDIQLPNIAAVRGRTVWAESGKFGVAFDTPIDPQAVRRRPEAAKPATPPLMPFSVTLARSRFRKPLRPL